VETTQGKLQSFANTSFAKQQQKCKELTTKEYDKNK